MEQADIPAVRDGNVEVLCVAWSPDGQFLACGFGDRVLRIWDVRNGQLASELFGHTEAVSAIAYLPDGRRIVSASRDGTVRLWHLEGAKNLTPLRGHNGRVRQVRFAGQGQRLLTYGDDMTLRLWELPTGEEIAHLRGQNARACGQGLDHVWGAAVCSAPDGWRLLFEAPDAFELAGHMLALDLRAGSVTYVPGENCQRFVQGGRWVIGTSGKDESIRVWDVEVGQEVACFQITSSNWEIAAVSRDGQRILSAASGGQGEIRQVWDVEGNCELSRLSGLPAKVEKYTFSPNGQRIAGLVGVRRAVCLWDAERGGDPLYLSEDQWPAVSVTFSPDSLSLVGCYADGRSVIVWDAENGSELVHLASSHDNTIWHVGYSPDGRRFIAAASNETSIQVWDLPSGQKLSCFRTYPGRISSVEFSADGQNIISTEADKSVTLTDGDQTIRVWDAETGNELASLQEPGSLIRVKPLPDGCIEYWVAGAPHRVWDFRSGSCRTLEVPNAGQSRWQAVEAGTETEIQAAETGAKVARFPLKLWHLALNPDGRTWAGAAGNHVYLFTLEGQA